MKPIHAIALAFLALALPLSASPQDITGQAQLETTGLYGGTTLRATITSTELGQPAWLLYSFQNSSALYPLPNPVILNPALSTVLAGQIGIDGRFEVAIPLPPAPLMPGRRVYAQGAVMTKSGHAVATERIALIGESSSSANFTDLSTILPATALTNLVQDVDAVDINRDGLIDISLATNDGVQLFINSGTGFVDLTDIFLPFYLNGAAAEVEWADVDNDGDLDMLFLGGFDPTTSGPRPSQLLLNAGNGYLAEDPTFNFTELSFGCSFGDIDGDGDLDLALAVGGTALMRNPAPDRLLINQGGHQGGAVGQFAEDAAFSAAAFNQANRVSTAAIFGDIDRDGDLDLFFARVDKDGVTGAGPGDANVLLVNDGLGNFSNASAAQLPTMNGGEGDDSSDAAFADVNGDGWLDIVVANAHTGVLPADSADLLINSGAAAPGVFVDAPSLFPDAYDPDLAIRLGIETGDIDLDGDIDVIVTQHDFFNPNGWPLTIGKPGLFVNQGGAQGGMEGRFMKDTDFFKGLQSTVYADAELFDLDADGDLDCYAPGYYGIIDPSKNEDVLLRNDL